MGTAETKCCSGRDHGRVPGSWHGLDEWLQVAPPSSHSSSEGQAATPAACALNTELEAATPAACALNIELEVELLLGKEDVPSGLVAAIQLGDLTQQVDLSQRSCRFPGARLERQVVNLTLSSSVACRSVLLARDRLETVEEFECSRVPGRPPTVAKLLFRRCLSEKLKDAMPKLLPQTATSDQLLYEGHHGLEHCMHNIIHIVALEQPREPFRHMAQLLREQQRQQLESKDGKDDPSGTARDSIGMLKKTVTWRGRDSVVDFEARGRGLNFNRFERRFSPQ